MIDWSNQDYYQSYNNLYYTPELDYGVYLSSNNTNVQDHITCETCDTKEPKIKNNKESKILNDLEKTRNDTKSEILTPSNDSFKSKDNFNIIPEVRSKNPFKFIPETVYQNKNNILNNFYNKDNYMNNNRDKSESFSIDLLNDNNMMMLLFIFIILVIYIELRIRTIMKKIKNNKNNNNNNNV
jgi:hypothetical protein